MDKKRWGKALGPGPWEAPRATSEVAETLDRESAAKALVLKPPALSPWTRHWASLTLHVLM